MTWLAHETTGGNAAVLPLSDLIDHSGEDCVCGPDVEPVKRDDGSVGWVVTHHSLDGREAKECQ